MHTWTSTSRKPAQRVPAKSQHSQTAWVRTLHRTLKHLLFKEPHIPTLLKLSQCLQLSHYSLENVANSFTHYRKLIKIGRFFLEISNSVLEMHTTGVLLFVLTGHERKSLHFHQKAPQGWRSSGQSSRLLYRQKDVFGNCFPVGIS